VQAVVHIGMSKTGTTSIQIGMWKLLKRLAAESVCYPTVCRNHGVPIGSLFVADPNNWKPNVRESVDAESRNPKVWDKLNAELSIPHRAMILSGEAFLGLPPDAVARMVEWLRSIADDVRIVLYVREPKSWAVSSTQQKLKTGAQLPNLPVIKIRKRLTPWIKAVGKDRVAVYNFDVARKHRYAIGGHFVEQIGLAHLAEHMDVRANESLSAEALRMVAAERHALGRKLSRVEIKQIAAEAPKVEAFALPADLLAQVERAAQPDVEWLAAEFGISFSG